MLNGWNPFPLMYYCHSEKHWWNSAVMISTLLVIHLQEMGAEDDGIEKWGDSNMGQSKQFGQQNWEPRKDGSAVFVLNQKQECKTVNNKSHLNEKQCQ